MRWDEEAVKWWWQKDEKLGGFTLVYKGAVKPRVKPEIHMNATVNIICYKQKTLSNGEHPLMLRITKNGKRKYKSLGISVHPTHWDFKTNRPKPKCPNRELILKTILEKEAEFQKEILEFNSMQKEYTASSLMAAKTNQTKAKTVEEFYNELIEHHRLYILSRELRRTRLRDVTLLFEWPGS